MRLTGERGYARCCHASREDSGRVGSDHAAKELSRAKHFSVSEEGEVQTFVTIEVQNVIYLKTFYPNKRFEGSEARYALVFWVGYAGLPADVLSV